MLQYVCTHKIEAILLNLPLLDVYQKIVLVVINDSMHLLTCQGYFRTFLKGIDYVVYHVMSVCGRASLSVKEVEGSHGIEAIQEKLEHLYKIVAEEFRT